MHRENLGSVRKIGRYPIKVSEVLYIFQSFMSIVFTSFKNPKLPIRIKIPVTTANCLYLHDSFISKFKFMNYLFAKPACCMVESLYMYLQQEWKTV